MTHQVSNIGPSSIKVFAFDGTHVDLAPGAIWTGELWSIVMAKHGKAEWSVEPIEK